jgi:hypothetical protein
MDIFETPTLRSHKQSTLSQKERAEPDSQTNRLKQPLITGNEEFPNKLKNRLTIQGKEAPVAAREQSVNDSKIGQRVLAIRRADFSHTHEIASGDFNTLQYDIMSTFEMADLDE